MAKTPLFDHLVRAIQLTRRARRARIPIPELAEMEAERRALGRRELLGGTAAAAVLPFVSACERSIGPRAPAAASKSVAIVGAGLAGLHCAYRLEQLGVRATVFEASGRLGGRVLTDRKTFAEPDGMHCELGGELIDTGHPTMRDLASELSIPLLDYRTDDRSLSDLVAHIDGERMSERQILEELAPIAAKIDEALATLDDPDDYVYYDRHNGGAWLDALSISAWLDRIGAGGAIRKLLEVAYTTEYGLDPGVSNVLNLLFLISTDTTTFEIYGESDERFHSKEGNDRFVTKLASSLDPGQLRLGHRLEAIREAPDGRYLLSFANDSSRPELAFDHVVLAIPFSILRTIDVRLALPPVKERAIRELGYGSHTKLISGFSSRVWRTHGSNGSSFTTLPFQSTWETSRLQPGTSGILTNFTGGALASHAARGSAADRLAPFLDELEQVFPGVRAASNGKVTRFRWTHHAHSRGSYSAYLVGQYSTICGSEIERFERVHFCGEHTSVDAQGYMEGAALTGAMAAEEVAKDLGVGTELTRASAQDPRLLLDRNRLPPAQRIRLRALAAQGHRRWMLAALRARTKAA